MIRNLLSLFSWRYPEALVYMLQNTEYQVLPYLRWYWQTSDFLRVAHRRSLEYTPAARQLLLAIRVGAAAQVAVGLLLIALWYWADLAAGWQFGLAIILAYPILWAHLVALPLMLGKVFIVKPRQKMLIAKSEKIFRKHAGARVAIVGSYGKTSMKEMLLTVLGAGKKVAATPANKNVAVSHAHFAGKLSGDEEVVLIEYGEGAPGDIARFAKITHPSHAIVTGVAPAHLDAYKTIERAAEDIFSIALFVDPSKVYVNRESPQTEPYVKKQEYMLYDSRGALGWKVSDVRISIEGTGFTIKKGGKSIKLHSSLIGKHQIGPLVLAAALAHEFGLTDSQIRKGVAATAPFEHRMQPYNLGGAWVIDDTYNGNIEGVRAGTALLKELPAKRKVYVTPGLVDQGKENKNVHEEMGKLIAAANPDVVVLMSNSVTMHIMQGLGDAHYQKEVIVEDDPLGFYVNLQAFVANGDVVLMQNDWTDNYS
jgi:UDP-N-acetylmuramoyl-tripeptide--D-alanyl-D-alanine ligase